jgi:hypothetical protein
MVQYGAITIPVAVLRLRSLSRIKIQHSILMLPDMLSRVRKVLMQKLHEYLYFENQAQFDY